MPELSSEASSSTEEHLKAIVYQLYQLQEGLSKERKALAQEGVELWELTQAFQKRMTALQNLTSDARSHIRKSILESSQELAQAVSEPIQQEASLATQKIAQMMDHCVEQAQKTFSTYQKELRVTHWKVIGIGLSMAVVTGVLIVQLLMPPPMSPLTGAQLKTYYAGVRFEAIWPKLSKKEQERLLQLEKEGNKGVKPINKPINRY